MDRVKVLVVIPDLQGGQKFLDQIAEVSPRVDIELQDCTTPDEVAAALEDVEVLFTRTVPSHLDRASRLKCNGTNISWAPVVVQGLVDGPQSWNLSNWDRRLGVYARRGVQRGSAGA